MSASPTPMMMRSRPSWASPPSPRALFVAELPAKKASAEDMKAAERRLRLLGAVTMNDEGDR